MTGCQRFSTLRKSFRKATRKSQSWATAGVSGSAAVFSCVWSELKDAGGKLTLLSLAEGTPFDAGAVVHPAMIAPEDGEKLSVPLGFYPSHVN